MRTKEQILKAVRDRNRARRHAGASGMLCDCGNKAFKLDSSLNAICFRCATIEHNYASKHAQHERPDMWVDVPKTYVPMFKRFQVWIEDMHNQLTIHAHGDYQLKLQ